MSHKTADPFWTVRGVSLGKDVCLVIEAATQTAAECFATKRGVEVVFVSEANRGEVTAARAANRLWRYTPEARLKVLGRPVGHMQAACLVLCGLATVLLDLRANRVPMRLPVPKTGIVITLSGPAPATNAAIPLARPARFT